MKLIDTHCHLYAKEFDTDRALAVSHAEDEGIIKILMPAIDLSTHVQMLQAELEFPSIAVSMMGLHPCSVKESFESELAYVEKMFDNRPFVGVGETGLDFYWDVSFKKEQVVAFERQIQLALHYNIPVVIHSRNSTDECISLIQKHQKGSLKAVFHCFSGSVEQAKKIEDLNCYLGIGGVLTFKKSGLDLVLNSLDMSHIILETDSPYLAPTPFRGKRNESAYLKLVAQKLADVKDISLEQVALTTTENAKKVFNI